MKNYGFARYFHLMTLTVRSTGERTFGELFTGNDRIYKCCALVSANFEMARLGETEREIFLEEDVLQVSLICPFARQEDIRSDLMVTRSVETTVNNLLDGTVCIISTDRS